MRRIRQFILIDLLILAVISAGFLIFSWQKWIDPIWDFGREIYIPWRIGQGEVLYKDLAYLFGVFPPYWNALLLKIFGPSIMTLAMFNIIVTLLDTALIYRFFHKTFDRLTALMCAIVFLCLFAFNQYRMTHNMYYIAPYSHSYFYALFFALCSINILHGFFKDRLPRRVFYLGLCLGLMLLSRLEIFLALIIPVGLGMILFLKKDQHADNKIFLLFGYLLAGVLLPLAIALIYFSRYFPASTALAQIIGYNPHWGRIDALYLYNFMSGAVGWWTNVKVFGAVFLGYALVFIGLNFFCSAMVRRKKGDHSVAVWLAIILFPVFLSCALYVAGIKYAHDVFRGQSLFILVVMVSFWKTLVIPSQEEKRPAAVAMIVLCGWALLMLLKVPLRSVLYDYGLVYCLPGVLVSTVYLTYILPAQFNERYQLGGLVRVLLCSFVLILCAIVFSLSLIWIGFKNKPLGVGKNRLWTFDAPIRYSAGTAVSKFIAWTETNMKPGETFVTFPQGAMLNFLTKHAISGPHVVLLPAEMETYGEREILRSIIAHPPDYFVFVNQEMILYGPISLGENFGKAIVAWVKENYTEVWETGQKLGAPDFGIEVLKKNAQR